MTTIILAIVGAVLLWHAISGLFDRNFWKAACCALALLVNTAAAIGLALVPTHGRDYKMFEDGWECFGPAPGDEIQVEETAPSVDLSA